MLSFEERKKDHIEISLSPTSQTAGESKLDRIELVHEALPEINFSDIQLETESIGLKFKTPLYVASMTLGHDQSLVLNQKIAALCEERGWLMGVGSQRRQLEDASADEECRRLRRSHPRAQFFGNIGLSQLIQTPTSEIQRLVDSLEAQALAIHTNPLQECIQPEGTPQFRGGLQALEDLAKKISIPLIFKETGCGMSAETLRRLKSTGVAAVDISGKGGTHWGRVETHRSKDIQKRAGETFSNWGLSTVDSVLAAQAAQVKFEVWASGGVRTGLDAAKLLALGANMVGLAQPILQAAVHGKSELETLMKTLEYELKVAMFCLGLSTVKEFQRKKSESKKMEQENSNRGELWRWI